MKQKYKIMFIDEKSITFSLEKYAEKIDWLIPVGSIENKLDNINKIIVANPDIIVCNSIFPIFTNILCSNRINFLKRNCKFFILSANSTAKDRLRCYSFGVVKYIDKPKSIIKIFDIIKENI